MMLTWKYALPCFLVPFMFTQPEGLAILWRDVSLADAAVASVSAGAGVVALVCGVGGYLLRPLLVIERAALVVAGLLLLSPGSVQDLVGLALFAAVAGTQIVRNLRVTTARA